MLLEEYCSQDRFQRHHLKLNEFHFYLSHILNIVVIILEIFLKDL